MSVELSGCFAVLLLALEPSRPPPSPSWPKCVAFGFVPREQANRAAPALARRTNPGASARTRAATSRCKRDEVPATSSSRRRDAGPRFANRRARTAAAPSPRPAPRTVRVASAAAARRGISRTPPPTVLAGLYFGTLRVRRWRRARGELRGASRSRPARGGVGCPEARARSREDGAHFAPRAKKIVRPGFRPGSLPFAPVGLPRTKEKRIVYPKCFSPKTPPQGRHSVRATRRDTSPHENDKVHFQRIETSL